MPKRDWIKPSALGLVPIALVLIWASYYVGSQLGEARGQSNYNSASYERHAQEEISRACLSRDGVNLAECIAEVINTTNEQQRAESDLIAQTEMATWAFWMLMATIVIAAITGVGVVFVWQTLGATRAMASETTRIGEAQVRAYMVASAIDVRPIGDKDGNIVSIGFKVSLDNTGQSPANIHKLNLGMGLAFPSQKIRDETDKHDSIAFMTIGAGGTVKTVEMKMTLTALAEAAAQKGYVVAFAYCEYTDIFYSSIENDVTHSARIAAAIELDEDILNPKTKKPFGVNFTYLNPEHQD